MGAARVKMKKTTRPKSAPQREEYEIPWEVNADGSHAKIVSGGRGFFIPIILYLGLAKVRDVTLISGDFNGKLRMFRPWVSVFYLTEKRSHYYALYLSCWQNTNNPWHGFPSLCVRKAVWHDTKIAWTCYERRKDPKFLAKYLLTTRHVRVRNLFTDQKQNPMLKKLGQELIQKAKRGFKLEQTKRKIRVLPMFECEVHEADFSVTVRYFPCSQKCAEIEKWLTRFKRCIDALDFGSGAFPDAGTRLSYRDSIYDRFPPGVAMPLREK
jgi:hypothetical protein